MTEPAKDPSNTGDRELQQFEELPDGTKKLLHLKDKVERSDGPDQAEAQEQIDEET